MTAVREAVLEISVQVGDETARARLAEVAGLTAPPEQAELVRELSLVQAEAHDLLLLKRWDAQARESAETLGLLVDLTAPHRDTAAQIEQVQRWALARPSLSFLALQARQLAIPSAGEPSASTADEDEPVQPMDEQEPVLPADEDEPVQAADEQAGTSEIAVMLPAEPTKAADNNRAPCQRPAGPGTPGDAGRLVVSEGGVPEPSESRVTRVITGLISEQRLGMAASLEEFAGCEPTRRAALLVAALAGVVRHPNGSIAAALRAEFDHLDPTALASDTPSLLLAVPALLRIALVTGEPASGALLTELSGHVEPNLSKVAEQVGRRALHGILLESQALSVLADVTEVEREMQAIMKAANQVRTRQRTLRFKRSTDISRVWLDTKGILGRPLSIVEQNETGAVEEVISDIKRLSDSGFVRGELDDLDRRFQRSSGKRIEGAGKQDLLNLVQEALRPLADWVEAVRSIGGREARAAHWSTGEVAAMRSVVLERRDDVVTALQRFAGHGDPFVAAAATAAIASLTATFDILQDSRALPPREPFPALPLTAELLKFPGVSVDTALQRITLPADAILPALLHAVERSWDEGLNVQVEAENFEAVHLLLDLAAGQVPVADGRYVNLTGEPAADVDAAERRVRAELTTECDTLATKLRRARLNNEITDEQDGELSGMLEDARQLSRGRDLAAARRTVRHVAGLLPQYRAEARGRLTIRLEQLKHGRRVDGGTFKRIARLMDDGQLSTAEELIYFLEIDEDVPEVHELQGLQQFFPLVPDALPNGIFRELVMLVKKRGRLESCKVLDFRGLSADLALTAADALNYWRQMSVAEPTHRSNLSERAQLLPALRMIGIETGGVKKLDNWPRSRDRRFIEVNVNGIIGDALVPAFGSKLDGRLRVLLAWGQPSADLLMSWADGDPSGESLLIAHFGTMSSQVRRDLAAKAARRSAPIVVLDDAALVYLAAHGNGQMTATMNILLPFSNVNPYLRQKRGVVAPEMFYGRDQERRSVLDPDGTQLVFGGRGLGKSALLSSAAEQFEGQSTTIGARIAVYLDLKAVGIRADSPINQEAIWDALADQLTRRAVLTAPPADDPRMSPHEQVRVGLLAWLDADSRRRLLVLLDEADQFFEADTPEFLETTRLKALGQESNGRVKVVFAGLHSVQRYAKKARNAPFGHLAQRPTVIGPLRPQHAANLLTRPLAALGFGFEDPDLVNRVLGFCSYQPFLLQIFANRLIEAMHEKRCSAALRTDQPPYMITRADVEAVETHADLRADIRAAFHETLNLDHRYGIIAHVLAHHAHEYGLDARLSDKQLREECLSYWNSGFARLDVERFRSYLEEMTGLGVLAPNNDGRGWHLRSANVLRMIGTRGDVEAHLVAADQLSVPDEFLALESRQELPGGRRSPLTAAQTDDVLGNYNNQVRVVLGSHATGVEFVCDAVRASASVGNRFAVSVVTSRPQLAEELTAGKPGERRVIIVDMVTDTPDGAWCLEALKMAQTRRPSAADVTRAAVIVAGPAQADLWRYVFSHADDGNPDPTLLPARTVTLRRYDAATLRVWSLETMVFPSEERRAQLLRVTGGWPSLVERAAQLVKGESGADRVDESQALQQLEGELATSVGAARLVATVGLTGGGRLRRAFDVILSVTDSGSLTRAELEIAAEMSVDEPAVVVERLIALQVFDLVDDGAYRPEPLLARCWPFAV